MQNRIAEANKAGIEGLKAHLDYLRAQYLGGGKDESTMRALKESIDDLTKFLEEECNV